MCGNQKYMEIKEHYHKTKIRLFKCEPNLKKNRYRAESCDFDQVLMWASRSKVSNKAFFFFMEVDKKHKAQTRIISH